MSKEDKRFQFEFSLEILNHLGKGLYRSFATVIAEAVSNAWDAEAREVKITIGDDELVIQDDGRGMDDEDFQNKFLNVGYSRRLDPKNKSKRNVIGRKGIGKLAMLSVSERVIIFSKKEGGEVTGGKINNPELDKKIEEKGKYSLDFLTEKDKEEWFKAKGKSGTKLVFQKMKTRLNSEEIVRKYLATQFNFVFSLEEKDSFKIIVNKKEISQEDLKELNDNTQFLWSLGEEDKLIKNRYKNLTENKVIENNTFEFGGKDIEIKGFIASVKKPSHLLLRGSGGDFKAGINLFCNGRLRQENLFEEITSKRVTEEYLFGEVHVDGFEDENNDRFTSSREGIIKDDPLYQTFLKELMKIQSVILIDWDPWRRKYRFEGDIEDKSLPKYEKRLKDSENWREKDFENKIDEVIADKKTKETLKEKLKNLSYNNTMIYQDLFILENIFREYIKINKIEEGSLDSAVKEEKEIIDSIASIRGRRKTDEERHELKGKIVKEDHYLNYLDLCELAILIDFKVHSIQNKKQKNQKGVDLDAKEINPVRNPVMHTNEITEEVLKWEKIKRVIDYIERLKDDVGS